MAKSIIQQLVDKLDNAVIDFDKSIPGIQQQIADEVENLVRGLDLRGDTIKVTTSNLRQIGAFKQRIIKIIKDAGYDSTVEDFIKQFNGVDTLLAEYFREIIKDFKPSPSVNVIKLQTIDATLSQLSEDGLYANFINPITDILTTNATTGMSWQAMNKQLREYITDNKEKVGALRRWTKQITNGSINNFAGQYINIASRDLGLDWFNYQGPLMDSSRPWCIACHERKYLHRSEFQMLIAGDFPEFKEADGKIYAKTGLPTGMDAGTNVLNLNINCGGHKNNCQHQMYPCAEVTVPLSNRLRTYIEQAIKHDSEGFKI